MIRPRTSSYTSPKRLRPSRASSACLLALGRSPLVSESTEDCYANRVHWTNSNPVSYVRWIRPSDFEYFSKWPRARGRITTPGPHVIDQRLRAHRKRVPTHLSFLLGIPINLVGPQSHPNNVRHNFRTGTEISLSVTIVERNAARV